MEQASPSQRAQSSAALLPALGVFLLLPPFVTLFTGDLRVAGIPLIVLYVFGVWVALVVAAALLARRLGEPAARGSSEGTGP